MKIWNTENAEKTQSYTKFFTIFLCASLWRLRVTLCSFIFKGVRQTLRDGNENENLSAVNGRRSIFQGVGGNLGNLCLCHLPPATRPPAAA